MAAFVKGDVVEVTSDTPELEKKYFGGPEGRWTIIRIFKTEDGPYATITRVGQPKQRRNVPTRELRRLA